MVKVKCVIFEEETTTLSGYIFDRSVFQSPSPLLGLSENYSGYAPKSGRLLLLL